MLWLEVAFELAAWHSWVLSIACGFLRDWQVGVKQAVRMERQNRCLSSHYLDSNLLVYKDYHSIFHGSWVSSIDSEIPLNDYSK